MPRLRRGTCSSVQTDQLPQSPAVSAQQHPSRRDEGFNHSGCPSCPRELHTWCCPHHRAPHTCARACHTFVIRCHTCRERRARTRPKPCGDAGGDGWCRSRCGRWTSCTPAAFSPRCSLGLLTSAALTVVCSGPARTCHRCDVAPHLWCLLLVLSARATHFAS